MAIDPNTTTQPFSAFQADIDSTKKPPVSKVDESSTEGMRDPKKQSDEFVEKDKPLSPTIVFTEEEQTKLQEIEKSFLQQHGNKYGFADLLTSFEEATDPAKKREIFGQMTAAVKRMGSDNSINAEAGTLVLLSKITGMVDEAEYNIELNPLADVAGRRRQVERMDALKEMQEEMLRVFMAIVSYGLEGAEGVKPASLASSSSAADVIDDLVKINQATHAANQQKLSESSDLDLAVHKLKAEGARHKLSAAINSTHAWMHVATK